MKIISPSQLDTSNPGTWPIYYKVITWAIMLLFIFFVFQRFFISPANETIQANEQKISQLKTDYRNMYQKTLDLDIYKKRSQDLIAILDGLLRYLPLQSEIAQLIDNVHVSAIDTRINIDGFKPGNLIKKDYYDIMPITLNTNTQYKNFAEFSEALTKLERIMNIADFDLSIQKDESDTPYSDTVPLEVQSQLQTYIYNQNIEALRRGELPKDTEK